MTAPHALVTVRTLTPDDCAAVAELDVAARTTATLGFLGARFHAVLYRAILTGPAAIGLAAAADGRFVGFAIGSPDGPGALRSALRRAFVPLACAALAACARRPRRLRLLVAALRYPATGEGAELIVISVDAVWQRRGVARALIRALDDAFRARGVHAYRVSTKVGTVDAVKLYEGLGFRRTAAFSLFDEAWLVFERRLIATGTSS